MAAAASAGQQPTGSGSAAGTESAVPPLAPHPPQARVVITRPRIPQPTLGSRGTTINLRATVPPNGGQQSGQVIVVQWSVACKDMHAWACLISRSLASPPRPVL